MVFIIPGESIFVVTETAVSGHTEVTRAKEKRTISQELALWPHGSYVKRITFPFKSYRLIFKSYRLIAIASILDQICKSGIHLLRESK